MEPLFEVRQLKQFLSFFSRTCFLVMTGLLVAGVISTAQTPALTPGIVVAWGDSSAGQATIPAGLTDVTSIAADFYHSLAANLITNPNNRQ
jgi:hypothetical protein